jgi:hypothetical protein
MTRRNLGTVAVIAFALAAPTPAFAAGPWTVQSGGGTCGGSDTVCETIAQAVTAASDGEIVQITPGTYAESVAVTKALTLKRTGVGAVRVVGDGSANPPLAFSASGTSRLQGVVVSSGQAGVPAVRVTSGVLGTTRTVELDASILSGNGTGAGLAASTASGDQPIAISADHVTIADSGPAPAANLSQGTATSVTGSFTQSIIRGSTTAGNVTPSVPVDNDAGTNMGIFVNPGAEDFHLRADATSVIDQGGATARYAEADVDGEARMYGAAVDKGADEFTNHPPTAPTLSATPQFAYTGDVITATASSTDPDPGGSIKHYHWDFGDGTAAFDGGSPQTHQYASPNTYTITVYAVDNNGLAGPASQFNVGIFARPAPPPPGGGSGGGGIQPLPKLGSAAEAANLAADFEPPQVSIATPRAGQRLRIARGLPGLRGGVADDSGVLSVELALVRHRGAACDWFDGRRGLRAGSCGRIVWFRAVVDDFAWRYAFPAGARLEPGAYTIAVRATDVRHNRTPLGATAALAGAFRFVR